MSSTTLPVCPKTGSTSPSLTVHLCLHTVPGNRECALHDLMQVVALLVIDVTARENENTYEDRMTLAESRAKGVGLTQGMETMARTVACRLGEFNEAHRGEEPENGKVH